MRFVTSLFIVVPFLASCVVEAAPLPMPTVAASTSHANHANHAAAHPVAPTTPVHQSAHPKDGHIMGTMPASHHTLTEAQLHGHIAHIQAAVGPNHHVHATHEPGHDVHFHATPKDVTNVHHSVHTAGTAHDQGPQASLTLDQKNKISRGIYNQRDKINVRYGERVPGAPGTPHAHGRGLTGTIPIAHAGLKNGMTQAELHQHARWIDSNGSLTGSQSGHTHVHVTHTPGDDHVKFHAIPRAGVDHLHPNFPKAADALGHQDKLGLQNHLNAAGTQHYSAGSISGADKTFKGTIPAHSTAQMTPAHLDHYADHARKELIRQHNLSPQEAATFTVAASHKAGDTHVQFHSAPRGTAMHNLADHPDFPQFNQALNNAQHTFNAGGGVRKPWHHAELGALNESLKAKGATAETFNEHMQGHVVGVAGPPAGNPPAPCTGCHNTLVQMPVWHRNIQQTTRHDLEIQRAL